MTNREPGPLSELLLIRDSAGEPREVNITALELALTDPDWDVRSAAETMRDLVNAMEQVPAADRKLLLHCVSDVASAADRSIAASYGDRDGTPPLPTEDAQVRKFMKEFQSWPDRNLQPATVRRALETARDSAASGTSECRETALLFLGRSIADLDHDALVRSEYASHDLRVWLPPCAYGYYLPVFLRWDLSDPTADLTLTLRRLGGRALNLYFPDFRREHFVRAVDGVPHRQRTAFYNLLQLIRRRPDLFRSPSEQCDASVCWRFWWHDPANWSSDEVIG